MGYEILIENLCIEAIIGVLPSERKSPQRVLINASIHYERSEKKHKMTKTHLRENPHNDLCADLPNELAQCGDLSGEDLEGYLDYVEIVEHIATMLKQRKYGLLENALDEIIASLKTSYPAITKIDLSLKKPDISLKDIFAKKDYAKNASNASSKDFCSDFAKDSCSDSIKHPRKYSSGDSTKDICKDSCHKEFERDFDCTLGVRKIREFL